MTFEFDAILKGCGRPRKGVSESVWCKILDEPCNMPDDTPDCPVWIEYAESVRETKKRSEP